MRAYHDLLSHLLHDGTPKSDRTGTGTRSTFGYSLRIPLQEGFPLLTTKRVHFRSIVHELLWFLRGETNIRSLLENKVTIWSDWPLSRYNTAHPASPLSQAEFEARILEDEAFAAAWGDLGPVYGKQWRDFGGVDQMAWVVDEIRRNPDSRRLMVSAWNPPEVPFMALPPCHLLFQFYVAEGRLSCQVYQRSADVFLGVPFNLASYALLVHLVAQQTSLEPGDLIWVGGDVHLYDNHIEQAKEQLSRMPRDLPRIEIQHAESLFAYRFEDVVVHGYDPHPAIKAPVAV